MDTHHKIGRAVRKVDTETDFNTRRLAENFPLVERAVESFNKLFPFNSTFQTRENYDSASLTLRFSEHIPSCAISPPIIDIHCSATWGGFNNGAFCSPLSTTSNLDAPNPDFIQSGPSEVTVPIDGCYAVSWYADISGPSYYNDRRTTTTIFHNGTMFKTETFYATGVLILIGPAIYFYSAPSPIYGVVDCKAGDTLSVTTVENGVADPIPWVAGTTLGGYYYGPCGCGNFSVKLVASAETDAIV